MKESAGYTEADSACLAGETAAVYVYIYVVLTLCRKQHKGLHYVVTEHGLREIVFERPFVDDYIAASCGNEASPRIEVSFLKLPLP